MLRRRAGETLSYQREVDRGKLTAVERGERHCESKETLLRRRAHARNVSFSKLATAVNLPLSTSR